MRHFADMHPYVQLFFFICVLTIIMFTVDLVIIVISVVCGLFYTYVTDKAKLLGRIIMIPMSAVIFAVINAAFSHNGSGVLFYMNGQRMTVEALVYGAVMGVILSDVVIWTMCMSKVINRERIVYIFGKLPVISIVISMTFRYIPLFTDKYKDIKNNSMVTGSYNDKNYVTRLICDLQCFMTLVTWIFETGADTAESMEKRGFMSGKRSRFSQYRLRLWDYVTLLICTSTVLIFFILRSKNMMGMTFYPEISGAFRVCTLFTIPVFSLPDFIELKEEIKWRYLTSRI